ncbi:unnamed protein product, partial [Discosporangium mesarthrocarpum]
MTPEERKSVQRMKALMRNHLQALIGDLDTTNAWRKYGAFNTATNDFEFYPGWFTEPLETRLRFQLSVVHTQMFVSYVD